MKGTPTFSQTSFNEGFIKKDSFESKKRILFLTNEFKRHKIEKIPLLDRKEKSLSAKVDLLICQSPKKKENRFFLKTQSSEKSLSRLKTELVTKDEKESFKKFVKFPTSHFFGEIKSQITNNEEEFRKKVDYDEKRYEESKENKYEVIINQEEKAIRPQLDEFFKEYYSKKGFRKPEFKLSFEPDYNINEFEVESQLRWKRFLKNYSKVNQRIVKHPQQKTFNDYEEFEKNFEMRLRGANETEKLKMRPRKSLIKQEIDLISKMKFEKKLRVLKSLKITLAKMKRLHLILSECVKNLIFSKKPFQRPLSYEFIKCAKEGDVKTAAKLVLMDKFLVYEYDYVKIKKILIKGFLISFN